MYKLILFFTFIASIFYFASAKIQITFPENNATAFAIHKVLFSEFNQRLTEATKCGEEFALDASRGSEYSACIKALKMPKIYENKYLNVSSETFEYKGHPNGCHVVSDIIAKVCEEIEAKCTATDKKVVDIKLYNKIVGENWQSELPIPKPSQNDDDLAGNPGLNPQNVIHEPSKPNSSAQNSSSNFYLYLFLGLLSANNLFLLWCLYFRKSPSNTKEESQC